MACHLADLQVWWLQRCPRSFARHGPKSVSRHRASIKLKSWRANFGNLRHELSDHGKGVGDDVFIFIYLDLYEELWALFCPFSNPNQQSLGSLGASMDKYGCFHEDSLCFIIDLLCCQGCCVWPPCYCQVLAWRSLLLVGLLVMSCGLSRNVTGIYLRCNLGMSMLCFKYLLWTIQVRMFSKR